MTPIVPRIAIFSLTPVRKPVRTGYNLRWMADDFEIHQFNSVFDTGFLFIRKFSMIVTVGNRTAFTGLRNVKLPTLHFNSAEEVDGDVIYDHYITSALKDYNPTVSLFTPTYKTFEKFDRCYESVTRQSFTDWEWILLDDSPGNENLEYIREKTKHDHRIKIYKPSVQDGFVGSTKRQAASLCNGKYLVELDHDDELHHMALELMVDAFNRYPDAGFCFSDSCETFEDGGNVNYGNNFAMGYGKHYDFKYKGRNLTGTNVPVNASTVRHIVGVPNHFRAWERETYFKLQRHNNKLPVVDDYELLVRTFLNTRMIHIPECLYIQYMNRGGNNTQEPRRAEIQRLVDKIQKYYDKQIHDRILELNGIDWLWDETTGKSDLRRPPPKERSTLAYVYKL